MAARRRKFYWLNLLAFNCFAISTLLTACGGNETRTTEISTDTSGSGIETNALTSPDDNLVNTASSSYLNDLATLPVQSIQAEDYENTFIARANTQTVGQLATSFAYTQSSPVEGFIVKYKNKNINQLASQNKSFAFHAQLNTQSKLLSNGLSIGANQIAIKNNLTFQFKTNTHDLANVFSLAKYLPETLAQNIAVQMKSADPNIEYVAVNSRLYTTMQPNDLLFLSDMWALKDSSDYGIKAESAWNASSGAGVVIGVVDTGYRPHIDFAGRILPGYDFISDIEVAGDKNGRDNNPIDTGDNCGSRNSTWHGTHVIGTIAANTNNKIGVSGIAYQSKILPVRSVGHCGGLTSDIVDGLVWAAGGTLPKIPANKTPAKIINMSLGTTESSGICNPAFQAAITKARMNGAIVVVSAGNNNFNAQFKSPANCLEAITVGATNYLGQRASFSNFGSNVDISAPGVAIVSTVNSGTQGPISDSAYASYNGTSMATPHVAAVLGLILSGKNRIRAIDAENIALQSFRPFANNGCDKTEGCGAGIIDASKAMLLTRSTLYQNYSDLNGNGRSDILLSQNTLTGKNLFINQVNGIKNISSKIWTASSNESIVAIGDFNGDKKADLLEKNTITNQLSRVIFINYGSNGSVSNSVQNLTGTTPDNLHTLGVADLNADGLDDIISSDTQGKIYAVLMDGTGVLNYQLVTELPIHYQYRGSADFNSDGTADLVWYDSSNQTLQILYMNANNVISTQTIDITGFQLEGVGRFFTNSSANLLLRNSVGKLFVGTINENSISTQVIANLPLYFTVKHIGDYDGNGLDDIYYQKNGSYKTGLFAMVKNKAKAIGMNNLKTNMLIWPSTSINN